MKSKLYAFWFSKQKLQKKNVLNFGDDINPYLIEKLTDKKVIWKNPKKQNFLDRKFSKIHFAIGSIIHYTTENSIVWGSGLIDSKSNFSPKAEYLAVRGPETYKILKENAVNVNEVFGDPALLLPKYFPSNGSKKCKYAIIPHYTEYDDFVRDYPNLDEDIITIDLRRPVFEVLEEIQSCENIISSSLHGIIVGQAYNIPSLRCILSDKIYGDGIKYEDYYQSVGIESPSVLKLNQSDFTPKNLQKIFENKEKKSLIQNDLITLQDKLLSVSPF